MRTSIAAIFLLFWLSALAAQTPPDLHDYVLVAYELSPAQSAQFSDTDGRLSPFWEEWDAQNADSLMLDYVHMSSANSAYAWSRSTLGFDGTAEDAQLTIRAAYDSGGVYYFFQAVDNDWVSGGRVDAILAFIDKISSVDIWAFDSLVACSFGCCGPGCTGLSWYYRQFHAPYGGDSPADAFEYNFPDHATWTVPDSNAVVLLEAKTLYDGLCIEIVFLSEDRRAQEWFIPWSQYGVEGIAVPVAGSRLALSIGYDDADSALPIETDGLRWKNLCDPWCGPEIDTWGDLEVSGIPLGETAVRNPMAPVQRTERGTSHVEYFSLLGRRLPARCARSAVLVAREVGSIGRKSMVRLVVR